MRATLTRLAVTLCLTLGAALPAAAQARGVDRKPVLGDFAAEIRRPDGHIDVPAMIGALQEMRANTYFYLIWHAETDWEDLPEFAAAAERAGIDVWVYLIPWSETPVVKKSWGFSEPFRTDYVRWAEEVAKLSLRHPNIVGYVIDDFYTNAIQPDRFSVSYVREMVETGRAINPRLKFYPLVYFHQPWGEFLDRFGGLVDGVVAAYPRSNLQVSNALSYLRGDPHGASIIVEHPKSTPSRVGDKASLSADLRVSDADRASISFYWDDTDYSKQRGFHQVFVRVDGRVVWQQDTAGEGDDRVVNVNLARHVRGRRNVRVEIGVYDPKPVSNYPLLARIDDIRLSGFDTGGGEFGRENLWRQTVTGKFVAQSSEPSAEPRRRMDLPMILMPTGEGEQYEKRYADKGTPRNVANKVRMSLDQVRDGRVEGVVTYCLPKEGPTFNAVAAEFRRAAEAVRDLANTRAPRDED
jgi:hypothetical protein